MLFDAHPGRFTAVGCYFGKMIAVGYHHHFVEEAGGNGIVVGMADDGLVTEYLHEFGGKTGGRIAGRYHGNLFHTGKGKIDFNDAAALPQSSRSVFTKNTELFLVYFVLCFLCVLCGKTLKFLYSPNCKKITACGATGEISSS